jgi:hypothetical protein
MGSLLCRKFPQVYSRNKCVVKFQLRSMFSDAALHLHPQRFNGGARAASTLSHRATLKVAAIEMNEDNEQG